jgi:hypothetical protein
MKRILIIGIKMLRISTVMMMIALMLVISAATACQKKPSPTTTFEAFYESLKKKDVQAYKKTVSKKTLEMLQKEAGELGKSLDEYIKADMDKPTRKLPDKLETRHEKIEGDHATLEIKNNEGGWNTVPFVKEDGEWKVSLEQV